jgi:PAS domain S-box-containing protein
MGQHRLFGRYRQLQAYVGWASADEAQVRLIAPMLEPYLIGLVDDFYEEIHRHPEVRSVITGGAGQVERLKGSLLSWVHDLLSGVYDEDYVGRRWRVGLRHVEIGLDQIYANAALSRLRVGMLRALGDHWRGDPPGLMEATLSLTKLLDLDMAIIEDAYQAEASTALQRTERLATMGRAEERFRLLVQNSSDVITVLAADGTVYYQSPSIERILGYRPADRVGKNVLTESIVHPEDKEKKHAFLDAAASRPGETVTAEFRLRHADGSWRDIEAVGQNLIAEPSVGAIIANYRDISERRRAEERALRSERLAAIGQMVAGLAHESRNALQRCQACLEMLALADKDRPRSLDLIARIGRAQDDLHRLFEDVRSYAAPIRLERHTASVRDIWRGAWADLETQIEGRATSIRELAGDVEPSCNVDAFRLGQVFRNLFDNALAACADPVEISVHCEAATVDGHPGLRIRVRDNGPGLDAEQAGKLFEPFYTTKTRGTGLGLAIARRIVDAHGGRIDSGNAGGPGAEIIITLPRSQP